MAPVLDSPQALRFVLGRGLTIHSSRTRIVAAIFQGKSVISIAATMRVGLIQVLGLMSTLSKALALLAAFCFGVVCSFILAILYVAATYKCTPGPLEPCDAGAYVGFGLALLLSPILGAAFAYATHRWLG
jgi:hypothetical protein